jgi:hypothetical protein
VVQPTVSIEDTAADIKKAVDAVTTDASAAISLAFAALESIQKAVGNDKQRLEAMGVTPNLIKNVVELLDVHIASETVCEQALDAIRYLCRFGTTKATQCGHNVRALGRAGACDLVVSAAMSHLKNPKIALTVRIRK